MDYKEFLEQTVKECYSKADLCRALDKKPTGGNYATIDKIIKDYNLDTSHFKNGPWNKGIKYRHQKYSLEEILVENSPYKNTYSLKLRLFNEGILERKCAICGKTSNLELHHINGDSSDNRLENLQILCIEHHCLTPNYRNNLGKGRKHLTPEDLIITDQEEIRIREEAKLLAKRKNIKIKEAIELIKNSPNKSIDDFPKRKITKENFEERECPQCHKMFIPKRKEQKYCSEDCVHKSCHRADITKEILIEKLKELECNFTKVGKFFGISDNAIRKWCKKFDMPTHKENIIEYINNLGNSEYIKPIETKKNRIYDKELMGRIYKEGYNLKEIASYFKCDTGTVHKYLIEQNIEIVRHSSKRIAQYDFNNNLINIFCNSNEAFKWLRENCSLEAQELGHINECCSGKVKSAYGYYWKYISRVPINEIQ